MGTVVRRTARRLRRNGSRRGRNDLAARVAALEAEVQECRQVSLRLAELIDVVSELLVPLAQGAQADPAHAEEMLRRYQESVGVRKY